jgi:hypothetical protein
MLAASMNTIYQIRCIEMPLEPPNIIDIDISMRFNASTMLSRMRFPLIGQNRSQIGLNSL